MLWKRRTVLAGLSGGWPWARCRFVREHSGPLLRVLPLGRPALALDRAALEALPQVSFATSTIWTEGRITFSGPRLRDVLAQAGITEGRIMLKALNDYAVEMALEEMGEDWPSSPRARTAKPLMCAIRGRSGCLSL